MESSGGRVQGMLKAAVQSVQWTYTIFWQLCPHKGRRVLVWGDGYYNGAIKTRKTVQPGEETAEEAALQRSHQLRDLYHTLLSGDSSSKRASTALSPEDLTESEWFFLMCVSFSFPPPSGLPGKAYARREHVWLSDANEVDSKTFSRAILAKSAKIKTVVCIPLLDGVVELGTTDKVEEEVGFIYHIKSFFKHDQTPLSKPALSEHSTSNPSSLFRSSSSSIPPANILYTEAEEEDEDEDEDEGAAAEEEEEEDEEGAISASKLMQLDAMSTDDVQFPSPNQVSTNNLHSDFHMLAVTSAEVAINTGEDDDDFSSNYSQTVSIILQAQRPHSLSTLPYSSTHSSFATWTIHDAYVDSHAQRLHNNGASQCVLKYLIFTLPFVHANHRRHHSQPPPQLPGTSAQDDLGTNHVVAERRRREKLNERFITLRSMVPFVTKMDKVSILGDTIEYVKQLRKRIQDLEANEQHKRMRPSRRTRTSEAVEVSIIESDALLEMRCDHREGLLIDILQVLRELRIEPTAVQTAVYGGSFTAEIRAKVKDNLRGKKVSILDVKTAIHQILP